MKFAAARSVAAPHPSRRPDMEGDIGDPTLQIKRLQRCINDLVSILSLPAVWGGDLEQILSILLDALLGMLGLDFACARLRRSIQEPPIEVLRTAQASVLANNPQSIREALNGWFVDEPNTWPLSGRSFIGNAEISIVSLQLGLQSEIGVIIAGSARPDFPQETERLLLSVAANQAALGLQQASQFSEQKRLAIELDLRVAERTAELATINEELRKEIAERKRTEERLHLNENALRAAHARVARSEERWRSVFENSAIGVALTNLDGKFIATNPVYQTMLGYSEEELEQLSYLDVTHEEDQEVNRTLVIELLEGRRRQFQIEKRYRCKNGSLIWVRNNISVVPGTERLPQFMMALSEDITERKRFEEAMQASERELSLIVDTIPTLAWSCPPDGSADFHNRRYLEYTGLTPEQALGFGWHAAMHPDEIADVRDYWARIVSGGLLGEKESRLRRFDGTYRWFLFRANPLRDASGAIVKWYGTCVDIDDRKRTEERLRRSEAFLVEGQRLSRTGAFFWRTETNEVAWSDELYRIYEIPQSTPATLDLTLMRVHPDDVARLNDMAAQSRAIGADFEHEHRLLMPDRSVKYLHITAHATRAPNGALEYIGAAQDVTLRRLSEEALSQARSELAHVARITSLGALTASIAHEVNQPLSGIITNASTCLRMLSGDPPNIDGARETARRTIRDGNRTSEVIAHLRAMFSKKNFIAELVDLNDAALEVIALSQSELQRNRVSLKHELAENLPHVKGDRVQLQQVILNLLRNALEAMSPVEDWPRRLLVVTELEAEDRVRLSVQDTGIGFEPQAADRLFEAFYTTKNDGMGIGLSLCRSIVEAHSGRLWAFKNNGPGATFAFSIPVGPSSAELTHEGSA